MPTCPAGFVTTRPALWFALTETVVANIKQQILRAIEDARGKWGNTFELNVLVGNWGEIYDDAEMLAAIRAFGKTGRHYANVVALPDAAEAESGQPDHSPREIMVMPPAGPVFDDPRMQARIGAALARKYPQFDWRITIDGTPRIDSFVLIPLQGEAAAPGLLGAPSADLLRGARSFLQREFARAARLL